jgi:hypothetical protein
VKASIKAIETVYAGHRFRSRLEARWAVVLDALGIEWRYEEEGYDLGELGWYLPDFWLPKLNTYLEVKANAPTSEERSKLRRLVDEQNCYGSFGMALGTEGTDPCIHFFPCRPLVESPDTLLKPRPDPWPTSLPVPKERHVYQRMSEISFGGYGDDLVCPHCGSDYVHYGSVSKVGVHDDYPMDSSFLRIKGPILRIPFWSELCSHTWELLVAFHKGNTQLFYHLYDFPLTTPLEEWMRLKGEGRALAKGRMARFEHGESPSR